ncbi:MAG TPA: hypothetical protein VFG61_03465 [Gaiellaceae bacterium]|jgi:hypothetical protein|nr:hypothetical protein [Gaiellaceae bacterium]
MGSSEVERQVEFLLAVRVGVLEWPEGPGRNAALQAIDDVIVAAETGRFADDSPDA